MLDYANYYASIEKPFFAPEPWVFGAAWGIIYPLIAIAGVFLLFLYFQKKAPLSLVILFAINAFANFLFTPLQLIYPDQIWATLDIFVVLGTLALLEWMVWSRSKIVFALLTPYLLWGAFATVLQVTIFILNFF